MFRARELGARDIISNLKMQKLLYYAQGHFLATYQKPLFDDKIEAWEYRPVVKNVYDSFKCYDRLAIDFKELDNFKSDIYTDKHLDTLPFVFNKYNISAIELMRKTHNESPCLEYHNPYIPKEIPQEVIKKFFTEMFKQEV